MSRAVLFQVLQAIAQRNTMDVGKDSGMAKPEPTLFKKGKEFHRQVQTEWEETAQGDITREKGITKPSGHHGRIDIHVGADDGLVAVVEIKNSDWDAMTLKAVRRNARRYARQLWDYIDAEMGDDTSVSPGMIFPKRPKDQARLTLVEEFFWEEGIPVVWQDETIEEHRERAQGERPE